MGKKNILFLDIDGVLNSINSTIINLVRYGEVPEDDISEECVALLNWVLSDNMANGKYNIDIVISSTWRLLHSLDDIRSILERNGFLFSECIIDSTPRIKGHRGLEIDKWLKENGNNVNDFVILDDDSDMDPHMDKLVQCKGELGLTYKNVEEIIRRFGIKDELKTTLEYLKGIRDRNNNDE
jgi:hypothetical protein